MDIWLIIVIAAVMWIAVWLISQYDQSWGEFARFVLLLPVILPLFILFIWAIISIQTAPPESISQAASTGINRILDYFGSHILDVFIGDVVGIILGAITSVFSGSK